MNPFRLDVLAVSLLFAVPVLALGLRGDFSVDDLTSRLPWCLLAGWLVVSVVRLAIPPVDAGAHTPVDAEAETAGTDPA